MRFLFAVLLTVGFVGFLTFGLLNVGNTTNVTLLGRDFLDVPLWEVVFVALVIGVVLTAIYGIAEGTKARLENRRLRNEVRKLETEVNYLRTQPRQAAESGGAVAALAPAAESAPETPGKRPPSAPVYDPETGDVDPDDDIYSGGRAV